MVTSQVQGYFSVNASEQEANELQKLEVVPECYKGQKGTYLGYRQACQFFQSN